MPLNTKSLKNVAGLLAIMLSLFAFAVGMTPQTSETPDADAERFSSWQSVGPNGGDVRSIVVDPSNKDHFYFSTLDGLIYVSNDAGKNWRMLSNLNRPELILDSMMIDERDAKTIYVGGHKHRQTGGFFKSTDGGTTWREAKDLKGVPIYALEQSVSNPDMLLAGTDRGVFVSLDSGNDWKKLPNDNVPDLINVESLAVDPRNADIIYAGTWHRPYKTTDGGKTWKLIATGMIDDSDVFAINIDPRNPEHIISSACSGIYESKDAGENWKKVQGIPSTSRRTRDIMQHPSKAGYVYAGTTEGLWVSADGGTSWSLNTSRQLEINSISIHPDEPNKVYLGTNNYGIMVSSDYGKTFTQTNGGYSTRRTTTIVADREMPNRFYSVTLNTAMGGSFFFVSDDDGATWQASMKNFPARLRANTILQDETNPNTIYLGTDSGMYRSLDRGVSWAQIAAAKPKAKPRGRASSKKTTTAALKNKITTTAKKPTDSKTLITESKLPMRVADLTGIVNQLAPTRDGKNGILAATNEGLYRTYDMTQGWERIEFPENIDKQVMTLAVSSAASKSIWAGTAKSGLLISKDDGTTWQQQTGVPRDYPISHIELDPNDVNRVFVGTIQTLYLTRNGGESWDRRGGGLPAGDYNSIAINPANADEIFAASAQENRDGLFHSLDGGKSWERVDSSKLNLPSRRIWALSFDPRNPNLLLVGSHSAGIYRVERGLTAAVNQ